MKRTLMLSAVALLTSCGSLAPAEVPSAPTSGARAVVFDIDGTLTPDVNAVAEVRVDAAAAVRIYFERGYRVIYLSTRVSFLQAGIPVWLKENGFPASSVHVAETEADHKDPAAFKLRIMREYSARGWSLVGGYGDSSTDFRAYAEAGIPNSRVFALLRRGQSACEPGVWQECLPGWSSHLGFVSGRSD